MKVPEKKTTKNPKKQKQNKTIQKKTKKNKKLKCFRVQIATRNMKNICP